MSKRESYIANMDPNIVGQEEFVSEAEQPCYSLEKIEAALAELIGPKGPEHDIHPPGTHDDSPPWEVGSAQLAEIILGCPRTRILQLDNTGDVNVGSPAYCDFWAGVIKYYGAAIGGRFFLHVAGKSYPATLLLNGSVLTLNIRLERDLPWYAE